MDNEDFTSEFEFEDSEIWDDWDEMDEVFNSDEIENSDQEQNSMNILTINLIESEFSTYGWIMCGDIDSIKKSTHNNYQYKNYKNCKYYGIIDNRIDIVNQQIIILDDLKIMFCDYDGKIIAHCVNVIELNNLLTILK